MKIVNSQSNDLNSTYSGHSPEPYEVGELCVVIALLVLALLLRSYHLNDFPLMIHNDEMNCGLEARAVLHDPQRPFFIGTGWSGHPNFGYLFGGISLLISDSLWGLRLGSAIMGVFSLLWIYLFMREGFNRRIALTTLFLATVFHFHIYFSRIGTHFNHAAFFIPLCLWLALRASRNWNIWWCLAAGLCTGLALQVYPATHVLIPAFFIWIIFQLCSPKTSSQRKELIIGIDLCLISMLFSLSPMIIHYVTGGALGERSGRTFLFTKENLNHLAFDIGPLTYTKILWYQLQSMTYALLLKGDKCLQYGYQGMLVGPLLPFILWGLWISVPSWKNAASLLLLLVITLTWSTGGLLLVDPPAFQRLISFGFLLPAFAALGLECIQKLSPLWKRITLTVVLVGWTSWNATAAWSFYLHQPVWARDMIVRRLESDPSIKGLLFVSDQYENMKYESFLYMAPNVIAQHVYADELQSSAAQCPKPCAIAIPVPPKSVTTSPPSPLSENDATPWEQVSWPSDGGIRSMYWKIIR